MKDSILKTLAACGFGSRRSIAAMIKRGEVSVKGITITDFRFLIDSEADSITIRGKPVNLRSTNKVLLMMNKPAGVLSTTHDDRGRETIINMLAQEYRDIGIYPAGRLDKDSTGLLLLTNDGDLTYRITHPKFEVEKEYLVHIQKNLKPEEKRSLEKGILLDGQLTSGVYIKIVSIPPYNYSITLHEGKKRQVRLMFKAVGHPVLGLKRIRIGNLNIGDLPEGKTRQVSQVEIQKLFEKTVYR